MIYDEDDLWFLRQLRSGHRDEMWARVSTYYEGALDRLEMSLTQRVRTERRLRWVRDAQEKIWESGRPVLSGEPGILVGIEKTDNVCSQIPIDPRVLVDIDQAIQKRDTLEFQFGELCARASNYGDKPHHLYSKLAVMISQFHPEETLAYANMMRQYDQAGPQREALERINELISRLSSTEVRLGHAEQVIREEIQKRDTRIEELEYEVNCMRQALEPGPGPGVDDDRFVRIGRLDKDNRRSLWLREAPVELELRSGREAHDARVVVRACAFGVAKTTAPDEWQVPYELFRALADVFSRARYAAEWSSPHGQLEVRISELSRELQEQQKKYASLAEREFAGQHRTTQLENENESLTDRLFAEDMRRYLESAGDPGDES